MYDNHLHTRNVQETTVMLYDVNSDYTFIILCSELGKEVSNERQQIFFISAEKGPVLFGHMSVNI